MNIDKEIKTQEEFYRLTAGDYDEMHNNGEFGNKMVSLHFINLLRELIGAESILDVGCGTGASLFYFLQNKKELKKIIGIEPYSSMIDVALRKGISPNMIIQGRGEKIFFPDKSFDVVFELDVLHHARKSKEVVLEMARVAKKAVFLADGNRFAQGSLLIRVIKLLIYKMGFWPLANLLKTGLRGYSIKKGDGLVYSYSVFDSINLFSKMGWKVFLIPTDFFEKGNKVFRTWMRPLLTSEHVLLCAFRKDN
jgi:ubiquinone/menaquinone biosynthesis C-methylase UbiE